MWRGRKRRRLFGKDAISGISQYYKSLIKETRKPAAPKNEPPKPSTVILLAFQKPDKVLMLEADSRFGKFEFRPLEPGFGITVGNALRRILLSSLEGFAITTIRIDGVEHEFSSVPAVYYTHLVDKLKEELKKVTDKDIQINIFEVKRPELDAVIVANNIARQVEGKIAYRRAIKMAIANTMRMGAEGIKIQISGRLNGAEMARSEMYKEGRTPLHTFRADIDYCHAEALTKVGLLGIKVWICRGEVFGKRELAPNFTQSKESGRGNNGGNNGGKNFKRKKNNR